LDSGWHRRVSPLRPGWGRSRLPRLGRRLPSPPFWLGPARRVGGRPPLRQFDLDRGGEFAVDLRGKFGKIGLGVADAGAVDLGRRHQLLLTITTIGKILGGPLEVLDGGAYLVDEVGLIAEHKRGVAAT
jgi:hypothetical protein